MAAPCGSFGPRPARRAASGSRPECAAARPPPCAPMSSWSCCVANERRLRAVRTADRPVTLVDSSVILDVLTADPDWAQWSSDALARARDDGELVINLIVYAEVS